MTIFVAHLRGNLNNLSTSLLFTSILNFDLFSFRVGKILDQFDRIEF